jgi:HlyD family secretion protein
MPGMTASTTIFVNEKKDILVVPGKAIRFAPVQETYSSYLKSLPLDTAKKMEMTLPVNSPEKDKMFIWTKSGQTIHQHEVKIGTNDGINYELLSGLKEGDEIVLSMSAQKAAATPTAKSPFMPTRPGQKR